MDDNMNSLDRQVEKLSLHQRTPQNTPAKNSQTDTAAVETTIKPSRDTTKATRKTRRVVNTASNTNIPPAHTYITRSKSRTGTTGKVVTTYVPPHLRNKQATHTRFNDLGASSKADDGGVPLFPPVGQSSEFSPLHGAITKPPSPAKGKPGGRRIHKQPLTSIASLLSDIPTPSTDHQIPTVKRPKPAQAYLQKANQQSRILDSPRPLLVVLDLNGTLLFRKKRGSNAFIPRPRVNAFLDYLFGNHIVMVWSSARPENVAIMCSALFTPEQQAQLVAVWARDKLRLSKAAYNEKVQVYKQLSWVWKDATLQGKSPWSQADTVLIDDSMQKAASEPFNLIQIDEFDGKPEQMEVDVLGQVMQYLQQLQYQGNVSAFMRTQPFKCIAVAPRLAAATQTDTTSDDIESG